MTKMTDRDKLINDCPKQLLIEAQQRDQKGWTTAHELLSHVTILTSPAEEFRETLATQAASLGCRMAGILYQDRVDLKAVDERGCFLRDGVTEIGPQTNTKHANCARCRVGHREFIVPHVAGEHVMEAARRFVMEQFDRVRQDVLSMGADAGNAEPEVPASGTRKERLCAEQAKARWLLANPTPGRQRSLDVWGGLARDVLWKMMLEAGMAWRAHTLATFDLSRVDDAGALCDAGAFDLRHPDQRHKPGAPNTTVSWTAGEKLGAVLDRGEELVVQNVAAALRAVLGEALPTS